MSSSRSRWSLLALAWLVAIAWLVVGCSTDDGSHRAPLGGADASAPDDARPADVFQIPARDTGPMVENACDNTADRAALLATYDDGAMPDAIAGECATQCFLDGTGTESCVRGCIDERTGSAITAPCVSCMLVVIDCVQQNCIAACAPEPFGMGRASDACRVCQCGGNEAGIDCRDRFFACSGVASTRCEGL